MVYRCDASKIPSEKDRVLFNTIILNGQERREDSNQTRLQLLFLTILPCPGFR